VLKCADLNSNLTDLHPDIHSAEKFSLYLDETEQFALPMARKVNANMVIELTDMVDKKREILLLIGEDRYKNQVKK
jgi:hypothetical protein